MKTLLIAVLLLLPAVTVLVRFLAFRVPPFERLMGRIPSDTALCHFDQCVKEIGHLWFFYSHFAKEDERLLTLSLNVPRPDDPADEAALDADVSGLIEALRTDVMAPTRCEWKEMQGSLAWRLYLEFDWETVSADRVIRLQNDLLTAIRTRHADTVRHHFRGSGTTNIYYSEQVGNVIERSVDMESAFDIRKYSFKSEGILGPDERMETPAAAEEFEELYIAAKPDIDTRGLALYGLRSYFRELLADGVILEKPLWRTGMRRYCLEAWFHDREGEWCNWNIRFSDGAWWVFSMEKGELGDIYELTDEEEACDLFVRYVVEGLQDAEDEG